jgi:hypothetical protein
MTYRGEFAIVSKPVYKGYWEQPSVQNFTVVFYTEADRNECFDNVMTPGAYPTPD